MKTPHEMAAVGKEFSEQTALFAWAAMARNFGQFVAAHDAAYQVAGWAKKQLDGQHQYGGGLGYVKAIPIPELKWLHAIKNQGHGDAIRGARSAAEGVKRGVFDTFLPWPMARISNGIVVQRYYGLYIELKRKGKSNTSAEQLEFGQDMKAAGYAAEICVGWEAARDVILAYLPR